MRSLLFQPRIQAIGILRIVLILFVCMTAPTGNSESDPSFSRTGEPGMLHVSEKHQKLGGIITDTFQPADYQPETRAFGKVLSLDPLLELEQQLQKAESERKVAAAALATATAAYRQVQDLFKDQAVARVKLEQSKMDWISASAGYDQAVSKLKAVRLKAMQNWGKVLTEWASAPDSREFGSLFSGKSVLLAVSLRSGERLPDGIHAVFVHRGANRSDAQPAELISVAPLTVEKSQGESYFFHTLADSLRTGMHLYVWIPMPGKARRGIEIPSKALVWRDGKAWAYQKVAPESFRRVSLENALDQDDRWFLAGAPDQNAEIVVSGGQMLLSQEFRWQIPDEDEE